MRALFSLFVFFVSFFSFSQKKYSKILKNIDDKKELYSSIAQDIWSFAEMGYQEKKSSNLLKKILSDIYTYEVEIKVLKYLVQKRTKGIKEINRYDKSKLVNYLYKYGFDLDKIKDVVFES